MPNYFDLLPPELIHLLALPLPTASLNALVLTSRRLRETLQPDLEARITPDLAKTLLLWAAASDSRLHIVTKLLVLTHPSLGFGLYGKTPLHAAAKAGAVENATLLLAAGADPNLLWDQEEWQPLHLAVVRKDLAMATLLLDHGAELEGCWGCDGASRNALHQACSTGDLDMVALLLARGANVESRGDYGTALGFAVHARRVGLVKLLLDAGANIAISVPFFVLLVGGPPPPLSGDLLYLAMGLPHPGSLRMMEEFFTRSGREMPARYAQKWKGQPLPAEKKQLMAILLAYGAKKEVTMALVSRHLTSLAREVGYTEEEYLAVVVGMLDEADDAVPDVLAMY